jgi:hypothetical protein
MKLNWNEGFRRIKLVLQCLLFFCAIYTVVDSWEVPKITNVRVDPKYPDKVYAETQRYEPALRASRAGYETEGDFEDLFVLEFQKDATQEEMKSTYAKMWRGRNLICSATILGSWLLIIASIEILFRATNWISRGFKHMIS